jgi:hypothetical protein
MSTIATTILAVIGGNLSFLSSLIEAALQAGSRVAPGLQAHSEPTKGVGHYVAISQ